MFICFQDVTLITIYYKLCLFFFFFFLVFNYSDMVANVKKTSVHIFFFVLTNISCFISVLCVCVCLCAIAFWTQIICIVLFSLPREIRSKCLNELTISFRFLFDFSPTTADFHRHAFCLTNFITAYRLKTSITSNDNWKLNKIERKNFTRNLCRSQLAKKK